MKNLAKKVVQNLIKKKLKVSFVESCTGGLLSSSITSISGSSKVFNLGLVTYSNKAKIDIHKVPKKIISK
jgi:PncC family amidohydrolase